MKNYEITYVALLSLMMYLNMKNEKCYFIFNGERQA